MALGATIRYGTDSAYAGTVQPMSLITGWQTVIDAGGVAAQDAATIQNPTTQIVGTTTHIINVTKGTTMLIRLGYDDGLTTITNPVLKVFGRTQPDGAWMILPPRTGTTVTLTTAAASDVTDGTLFYTAVATNGQMVDILGCAQILLGVQTALAGTGTTSNAVVQVKFI